MMRGADQAATGAPTRIGYAADGSLIPSDGARLGWLVLRACRRILVGAGIVIGSILTSSLGESVFWESVFWESAIQVHDGPGRRARVGLSAAEISLPPSSADRVEFARDVQPILQRHCVECHGPERQRSSFRVDHRQSVMEGGDLGPPLTPGKSEESSLIHYVSGQDDGMRMPPEGEGLSAQEIGVLRRWIDDGAEWPDELAGDRLDDQKTWWSLRSLSRPTVPQVADEDRCWVRGPIDAFVVERLRQAGLSPSEPADRRTLLRRLKLDLLGLPPTERELEEFMSDSDPHAYERLVDRMLASPRYGERWARHWLDVVHYADSHGQDQDRPRPHAWPYRDYLIRSFNSDEPYGRFVRRQMAGDVLEPQTPEAIVATGFLAAGPWDESSLRDIREDSIDRLIGQYLDRDDIVSSTMATFTAMTVGCARCHDHKFDPISQEDYYALQAVFAATDKAERQYDPDPQVAARRQQLQRQLAGWDRHSEEDRQEISREENQEGSQVTSQELTDYDVQELSSEIRREVEEFERSWRESRVQWQDLIPVTWESSDGSQLRALLDRSLLAVGPRPDRDTYHLSGTTELRKVTALRLEVLTDETLPKQGPGRQDNGNFHLTEIRVLVRSSAEPGEDRSIPLRSAVADFNQEGWGIERTLDGNSSTAWGIHPAVGQGHEAVFLFEEPVEVDEASQIAVELAQLHGGGHLIGRWRVSLTSAEQPELPALLPIPDEIQRILELDRRRRTGQQKWELARWIVRQRLERELADLPEPARIYCGTSQFEADGSFRPAAEPRPIHVLVRGDVTRARHLASPGALSAIGELPGRFSLAEGHAEGERRASLARWLSDPQNPLTWRVAVNRIWHYHFGRGLVETPNDFGRMGGEPSHPELLDFLAATFQQQGGSLKRLHREIVTSSTYRQSSRRESRAAEMDADNHLLWRMNRRRMDAETVRDSLLAVSGSLNEAMYGPPVMHFIMTAGVHVTPNADYAGFVADSPEAWRRSVYRFVLRTRPDPWMEALDCPDASQSAPVRNDSIGPLQALALWNNQLVLQAAESLAEQAIRQTSAKASGSTCDGTCDGTCDKVAESKSGGDGTGNQVTWVCQRVLGRDPTDDERTSWEGYVREHGLANFCRVILNSSEFLFID